MSVDPITCHILDTTLGKPASGVIVQLFHISNDPSLSSISEDSTTPMVSISQWQRLIMMDVLNNG